ncbi:helix-turn-helix domain-containing protein [Pedobacter caeni]|uniref:Transcriptional regulator, contains XRE-family HTH domain n=1 Tax=Pedobacter caeni TaxID=288992 RepID=A0A1M5G3Y4_9SPHI|nr:helix-turn-helix transcriptional regulator [Pedobacter caeni]SHF98510.1 Transcriptional regulator, contains XRE-family HTH domain [Pedobacter caeni]
MQEILSKKDIGERIKDLRLKNGLSQSFIAEILNLSRSNYSQIELGNQYPSFHTLHSIARYYSKSYEWLLHGPEGTQTEEPTRRVDLLIKDLEVTLKGFSSSLAKLEQELIQIKNKRTEHST